MTIKNFEVSSLYLHKSGKICSLNEKKSLLYPNHVKICIWIHISDRYNDEDNNSYYSPNYGPNDSSYLASFQAVRRFRRGSRGRIKGFEKEEIISSRNSNRVLIRHDVPKDFFQSSSKFSLILSLPLSHHFTQLRFQSF